MQKQDKLVRKTCEKNEKLIKKVCFYLSSKILERGWKVYEL